MADSGGSTVSKDEVNYNDNNDDDVVLSSEESSCYPDESGLELGLGLCTGGGGGACGGVSKSKPIRTHRILTAKDFTSGISGNKRTAADSVSPPNGQVVGWPPVGNFRMNSLASQAKSPPEDISSIAKENKTKNFLSNNANNGSIKDHNTTKERGSLKSSLFVKVNMDGSLIGRKVNLNAHNCYESLAQALEEMFGGPTTKVCDRRSSTKDRDCKTEITGPSKLLDGSSEFVLTYEDREGDWMLVGDVPWQMFLGSVKRLRIMRTSEANGLSPRFQDKNGRLS